MKKGVLSLKVLRKVLLMLEVTRYDAFIMLMKIYKYYAKLNVARFKNGN